ncbi:MAG: hypothetical protein ACRDZO_05490 [Egibacteraceae bacterium]
MRPLLGQAVHARGRERAVGVEPAHAGAGQERNRRARDGVARCGGVGPVGRLRPTHQPPDLTGTSVGLPDLGAGPVPQHMRRGRYPAAPLCHERHPLDDPRVDDELTGFTLKLAQDSIDGYRYARHDGLDVRVHQRRKLLSVIPPERPHLK